MKKENKFILRAMKAALKAAEVAERIRVKNDSKYGTSSAMRPGGVFSPKTDTTAEPPTGKILFRQGNGDPKEQGCEAVDPFTSRILKSRDEELKRLRKELDLKEVRINSLESEVDYWRRAKPIPTYLVDFDKAETVILDEVWKNVNGKKPYTSDTQEKPHSPTWKGRRVVSKEYHDTEKTIEDFAGDDTPHVEKLLEPLGDTPRTLVHLKSPELGTETLVALSPEGETLLRIVKDNSRKFEVR